MKYFTRRWRLFIIASIAFLSLPFFFTFGSTYKLELLKYPYFQRDFTGYIMLLGCFYASYFYSVPNLYFRKRYFLFLIVSLASYALVILVPNLLFEGNNPISKLTHNSIVEEVEEDDLNNMPNPSFIGHMTHFFFQYLLVMLFAIILRVSDRLRLAEQEKLSAELSYLRAQINPHFLFNTLNSIYSMAIDKSESTPSAIIKLSTMMRYVVYDSSREKVDLSKEVGYIANYFELQKFRLGNTVQLQFAYSGNPDGKLIAPMILAPFVENAFKHGVNPEVLSLIKVNLLVSEKYLEFSVFNNKVKLGMRSNSSSGIGVENVKARLERLYPDEHKLLIEETPEHYSVWLSIKLS